MDIFNKAVISINTLRVKLGSSIKARQMLSSHGYITEDGVTYFKPGEEDEGESKQELRSFYPDEGDRPVLVTSYLIGSHVDPKAWTALTAHSKKIDANIVIIAHRYSNPTSLHQSLREEENGKFIDPLVKPYLTWEDFTIYNHNIAASVRINPTTVNPLPAARKFCVGHTVIGHAIQAMDVKATTVLDMPNVLWTTGTISKIDKADNLRATVAQFHYKYGWIVVEPDGSSRNIHMTKAGQFTDLEHEWDGEKWLRASYPVVVWGDYHHGQTSREAKYWAIDLTRRLNAGLLVLHDFIDASTVNPHASGYERSLVFGGSLEVEIYSCVEELKSLYRLVNCLEIGLVVSNHNDMVSRYLNSSKVSDLSKGDQLILARWLLADRKPEQMVKTWLAETNSLPLTILDETVNTGVTNLGLHGDVGSNGSKGSIAQFFSLSFKAVIGHSHSPGMLGGVSQVGTLTNLRLGYNNRGLSDWLNSIVTVNRYNKHQHLIKFFTPLDSTY